MMHRKPTNNSSGASTRRRFLANAAVITSSTTVISAGTANANPPMLDESDPLAVALGYKADATTVDTEAFPKRAGAAGAQQFCSNCALYKKVGDSGSGTCSAIPGKIVAGAGWCNVWVKG